MARKWYDGKNGTQYTSVVFESGMSKNSHHQWKTSFQTGKNEWCSVVVYDDSTYTPSTGKHSGNQCCPGSVSFGRISKNGNGGENFPRN